MRFLVDACTGPNVAAWLREQDYEFACRRKANGFEALASPCPNPDEPAA